VPQGGGQPWCQAWTPIVLAQDLGCRPSGWGLCTEIPPDLDHFTDGNTEARKSRPCLHSSLLGPCGVKL
jgi:hypothetical protein